MLWCIFLLGYFLSEVTGDVMPITVAFLFILGVTSVVDIYCEWVEKTALRYRRHNIL